MKLIIIFINQISNKNFFLSDSLINFLNKTALHIAVEKENLPIIKLLLDKNIDVNTNLILNYILLISF